LLLIAGFLELQLSAVALLPAVFAMTSGAAYAGMACARPPA
jgi:hypothetical protein